MYIEYKRGDFMTTTTITNFRQNLFEYIKSAIEYNDVIDVTTKDGNAVVMSKEEYNGLMETLYLLSHPKTAEEILDSKSEPAQDFTALEDIDW